MIISIEEGVRRTIQRQLGLPVVLHDTGASRAMYDLRIGSPDAPDIAIECVGAVDPVRTETWNIGPAQAPFTVSVDGDWYVVIGPAARVKAIRARLSGLLRACEELDLDGLVEVNSRLRHLDRHLYGALKSLGIRSLRRLVRSGSGEVRLGMTGMGGWVDSEGSTLPEWIGDFLCDRDREDVLSKLSSSGARECHVFVPVSVGGVPWAVESYLSSRIQKPPTNAPVLPPPVDAVWIRYGVNGLHWDGRTWRLFDATIPASPVLAQDP
jgi:hypothetical protein